MRDRKFLYRSLENIIDRVQAQNKLADKIPDAGVKSCMEIMPLYRQVQGGEAELFGLKDGFVVAQAVFDEDLDEVLEVGDGVLIARTPGPAVRKSGQ